MTSLAPFFYQQFFDLNGVPLAGGKIYSYAAGTTTPQQTFIDSTGSTPNTNPIILDSSGFASIWLGTLAYKFVVEDALGATIKTIDQVSYINPGSIVSSMIANGAVGSAQIAADGVETANLADQSVTAAKIANNTITGAQIADEAIGAEQIENGSITNVQISPTAGIKATQLEDQSGFSLGATIVSFYTFTVFAANATVGAVYSNNGQNFTVLATIVGATTLICQADGPPLNGTAVLTLVSGTGDATINASSSTSAGSYNWTVPFGIKRLFVYALGGGGGGGGGGQQSSGGNGATGGATSFNGVVMSHGAYGGIAGNGQSTGGGGGATNIGPSYADYYMGGAGTPSGGGTSGTGQPSESFLGGNGIATGSTAGGGGGASSLASGGNYGSFQLSVSPGNGTLGSGGGGGGGSTAISGAGGSGSGGNGARGILKIRYVSSGDIIPIVIGSGGGGGGGGGGVGGGNGQQGGNGGDGFLAINY